MPRIRCHYSDCVFIDDGYCDAAAVEIDPDTGCMTYTRPDTAEEEDWDDEDELDEWDDAEIEDEDDLWLEDDDDF